MTAHTPDAFDSSAPTVQFPVVRAERQSTAESTPGGGQPGDRGEPGAPAAASGGDAPRRGRRALIASAVAAAAVVAAGGVAGYAYAGDVPRGTTVLGVELGGATRAEATAALRAELARRADRLAAPVPVTVAGKTARITPASVGLAVDVEATVAAATGKKSDRLTRLFGGHEVQPVVTVDAARLDAELRRAAGTFGEQMTMPAVVFEGITPKPVYPRPGKGLDAERSAQAVREGWLGGQAVAIPLVELHPASDAAEVDRLVAELAGPAVAAPVTVTTDRGELTIPPAATAKSLRLTADKNGKINPRIDQKALRAAIAGQLAKIEVKPKDATVSISGGKPRVSPSAPGQQVDLSALAGELLAVLPKPDGRHVTAALKPLQPGTTTEEIVKLGIKERVSTFTTHFDGGLSDPRSHNIVTAAKKVDGALVKPGKVFSLNGYTGPRGYAEGYKDAPVILDGKLVPGVGGGISQFTTTLFNATYYAGLEDVQHTPHSYWFSRYPSVIESTIFYPTLDFKFRNDTPYGVVIDTSFTSSSITVSIWSTKVYDSVTTEWSPRRDITTPETVYLEPGPTCIATDGINGFTQDAWRIFRKGGKEVEREKFTWRYLPEPRYRCAEKPA
ncbi:Vancomycin resistance protein YoaR, contains peptidoglycan-binding and VanW domains [Micromonospora pattaloongensis]|uniref:Vancomycin resistance protein YoaR, contains peptidoglycan-binding and VanW domains n=1 Tax=Micromonospora pattaloongensis TaxID=405436 RepID=A0A1H3NIM4_9ACTN|nr:VanW family protein [Micromonospora pattaloongensis]SDY88767.1 Vancomycin resistance protein YoaR, contains peptidoglycan-binding and VanW domains [Micromonospora pattaloongensis]